MIVDRPVGAGNKKTLGFSQPRVFLFGMALKHVLRGLPCVLNKFCKVRVYCGSGILARA